MSDHIICVKYLIKEHRNFVYIGKLNFGECAALTDLNKNAKIGFMLNGKPCIFNVHELIIKIINIVDYPKVGGLLKIVGDYDVEDFRQKLFRCVKKYDMDKYKEQVIVIMNIVGKNYRVNKLVTMGIKLHEIIEYFKSYDIVVELSINDIDDDDDDEEISFKLSNVQFEILDSSYFDVYNQVYHFVNDNQNSTIKYMLTNIINFINKKLGTYYDNSFYVEAFEAFKESL